MKVSMGVQNKETKEVTFQEYIVDKDECNRPQTKIEDLQKLKPVRFDIDPTATITAGIYTYVYIYYIHIHVDVFKYMHMNVFICICILMTFRS
jgi:hypothetical protein